MMSRDLPLGVSLVLSSAFLEIRNLGPELSVQLIDASVKSGNGGADI